MLIKRASKNHPGIPVYEIGIHHILNKDWECTTHNTREEVFFDLEEAK